MRKKLSSSKTVAFMGVLLLFSLASQGGDQPIGQHLCLDMGWRFHLGDILMPKPVDHTSTYLSGKAGRAGGAAAINFDDSTWRLLNLPHDYVLEAAFDSKENVPHGYRPRGIGWYRRYVRLDPADKGKHLELQFDAISVHAQIYVNGMLVHRNHCGYTPAYIDITPIATYGDELNVIAVRADAEQMEGWWYEGGGIYRHTWLAKRNPVHIETDGLYANPVRDEKGQWTVPVEVTVSSIRSDPEKARVTAELIEWEGKTRGLGGNAGHSSRFWGSRCPDPVTAEKSAQALVGGPSRSLSGPGYRRPGSFWTPVTAWECW